MQQFTTKKSFRHRVYACLCTLLCCALIFPTFCGLLAVPASAAETEDSNSFYLTEWDNFYDHVLKDKLTWDGQRITQTDTWTELNQPQKIFMTTVSVDVNELSEIYIKVGEMVGPGVSFQAHYKLAGGGWADGKTMLTDGYCSASTGAYENTINLSETNGWSGKVDIEVYVNVHIWTNSTTTSLEDYSIELEIGLNNVSTEKEAEAESFAVTEWENFYDHSLKDLLTWDGYKITQLDNWTDLPSPQKIFMATLTVDVNELSEIYIKSGSMTGPGVSYQAHYKLAGGGWDAGKTMLTDGYCSASTGAYENTINLSETNGWSGTVTLEIYVNVAIWTNSTTTSLEDYSIDLEIGLNNVVKSSGEEAPDHGIEVAEGKTVLAQIKNSTPLFYIMAPEFRTSQKITQIPMSTIDEFRVYLDVGSSSGSIELSIGTNLGKDNIGSASVDISTLERGGQWITFTFDTPLNINPGYTYYFSVTAVDTNGNVAAYGISEGDAAYSYSLNMAGGWSQQGATLAYVIIGTEAEPAVTEIMLPLPEEEESGEWVNVAGMFVGNQTAVGRTYLTDGDAYVLGYFPEQAIDITGMTYLEFDLYISDPTPFTTGNMCLEIGSNTNAAGWARRDTNELEVHWQSGWPALKEGWNHIKLNLATDFPNKTGSFDPANFNALSIIAHTGVSGIFDFALKNVAFTLGVNEAEDYSPQITPSETLSQPDYSVGYWGINAPDNRSAQKIILPCTTVKECKVYLSVGATQGSIYLSAGTAPEDMSFGFTGVEISTLKPGAQWVTFTFEEPVEVEFGEPVTFTIEATDTDGNVLVHVGMTGGASVYDKASLGDEWSAIQSYSWAYELTSVAAYESAAGAKEIFEQNNEQLVSDLKALEAYKDVSNITAENVAEVKAMIQSVEDKIAALSEEDQALVQTDYATPLTMAKKAVEKYEENAAKKAAGISENQALYDAILALTTEAITADNYQSALAAYTEAQAGYDQLSIIVKTYFKEDGLDVLLANAKAALEAYVPSKADVIAMNQDLYDAIKALSVEINDDNYDAALAAYNSALQGYNALDKTAKGYFDEDGLGGMLARAKGALDAYVNGEPTQPADDGCKSALSVGATAMLLLAGAWVGMLARKREK